MPGNRTGNHKLRPCLHRVRICPIRFSRNPIPETGNDVKTIATEAPQPYSSDPVDRTQCCLSLVLLALEQWRCAKLGQGPQPTDCLQRSKPHSGEALRKLDQEETQYAWMASKVRVNGHGDRHPGRQSVREVFERIDKDPVGWYLGSRSADVANSANTPVRFYYFMG